MLRMDAKKNDVTDRIRTCEGKSQHLNRLIAGCRLNHSATVTYFVKENFGSATHTKHR